MAQTRRDTAAPPRDARLMHDAGDNGRYCDLHLHSNRSDGADTPARVVERAAEHGLAAIALTDHDTLAGLDEAAAAARERGIMFLNGVEISSKYKNNEVHILGLGVRTDCAELNTALDRIVRDRETRGRRIVERLRELGVPIEWTDVAKRAEGAAIGRMHIAQEILALGHASTVQGAFDRYIKGGRPAYVAKTLLPCSDAIDKIHAAGGLAFVAHPGIGRHEHRLEPMLDAFAFDGVEVWHTRHTADQAKRFAKIAATRTLLVTGGSDCHGTVKGQAPEMGKVKLPYRYFEAIQTALAARA